MRIVTDISSPVCTSLAAFDLIASTSSNGASYYYIFAGDYIFWANLSGDSNKRRFRLYSLVSYTSDIVSFTIEPGTVQNNTIDYLSDYINGSYFTEDFYTSLVESCHSLLSSEKSRSESASIADDVIVRKYDSSTTYTVMNDKTSSPAADRLFSSARFLNYHC